MRWINKSECQTDYLKNKTKTQPNKIHGQKYDKEHKEVAEEILSS